MTKHDAVHKIHQAYADLCLAKREVEGFVDCDRKHRSLCFINDALGILERVVDSGIGKELADPMK